MRADAKRLWLTVAFNDDTHHPGIDPDASDAIPLNLIGSDAPQSIAVVGDCTVLRQRDGHWNAEKAATVQRDASNAVT